jgi:hypothetical protein
MASVPRWTRFDDTAQLQGIVRGGQKACKQGLKQVFIFMFLSQESSVHIAGTGFPLLCGP